MSLYLLESARGVMIGMLIVMIALSILFGIMLFMILRSSKKQNEEVPHSNIINMLARHEAHVTEEIEKCTDDDKKEALTLKLRRIKSAQHLIDEMTKEEEARAAALAARKKGASAGAVHHNQEHKPSEAHPVPNANAGVHSAPQTNGAANPVPNANAGTQSAPQTNGAAHTAPNPNAGTQSAPTENKQ